MRSGISCKQSKLRCVCWFGTCIAVRHSIKLLGAGIRDFPKNATDTEMDWLSRMLFHVGTSSPQLGFFFVDISFLDWLSRMLFHVGTSSPQLGVRFCRYFVSVLISSRCSF